MSSKTYIGIGIGVTAVIVAGVFALNAMDTDPAPQDQPIIPQDQPVVPPEDRLVAYASFYPYYEFTKNVAGDGAEVRQFIPHGVEAHDWEPNAGDIESLKEADIFVYNGLGIEPYVEQIIDSGEFDHIVFVKASDNVELIEPESHVEGFHREIAHELEEFEAGHMTESQIVQTIEEILHEHEGDGHDHGPGVIQTIEEILHEIEDGHISTSEGMEEIHHLVSTDTHEDTHEDGHHHHDLEYDPHIWLDPVLVKQQVDNIRDALVEADSDRAELYEQNAAAYNARLDAFDSKVRSDLLNCQKDTFVPFHNAFGYFGQRYDLHVFALGGLAPDTEASAAEISQTIDFIRDHDVNVVFSEDLVDPRLAEVIAEEAGAQVMLFSPIEALSVEEATSGVTFLDKFERNLDALKVALECR